jgi:hypothetical protein
MPRGPRPVSSLRLDIRLLGPAPSSITLPDGQTWTGHATALTAGPIVLFDGSVHIGVIPLAATNLGREAEVFLWRDGQETVISVVNYEGPPKMFWEYRSLSGPFWKGNLRNGFALRMADSSELGTQAFAKELALTPILDEDGPGSIRRVTFGDDEDAVHLEYHLREMWP